MSEYIANLTWKRSTEDFNIRSYNREHTWAFGSGQTLNASSAPEYRGDSNCVNPEEAFVASLSSCHMLTFLAIASMQGFCVDSYEDKAVGVLGKNEAGKIAMTKVTLQPKIVFSGDKKPSEDDLKKMHEKAHEECFIARSISVSVEVI